MSARATYEKGRAARLEERDGFERRSRVIGTARLLLVLGALGLLGGIVWAHLPTLTWAAVAAMLIAFVALVMVHARVEAQKAVAAAGARFHERGLARLDGAWRKQPVSAFESGELFKMPNHPYADDLDLFGPGSIFHRLSQAQTRFGAAELAFWPAAGRRASPRRAHVRMRCAISRRARRFASGSSRSARSSATRSRTLARCSSGPRGSSPSTLPQR
ncbi:MAG: hypothetical protein U0235_22875 [Polyangiaceae bacterium]